MIGVDSSMLHLLLERRSRGLPTLIASTSRHVGHDQQRKLLKQGLNALEFRHDLAEDRGEKRDWRKFVGGLPVLFTSRPAGEGGRDTRRGREKEDLLCAAAEVFDGIDIDLSLDGQAIQGAIRAARDNACMALASYHAYSEDAWAGSRLGQVLEKATEHGADAVKIAVQVDSLASWRRLAAFQAGHEGIGVATLGMGKYGRISRAVLPSLGSLFTFASIGEKTAEGQMKLTETRSHIRALSLLVS